MMELSSWLIFLLSSSARNRYTISVCMTINAKCRNSPNNNISTPFRDLGSWHVPVMKFEWVEKYMTFKLKSCYIYHPATDDIQRTATNGDIRQTTYSSKFCCNQPTQLFFELSDVKGTSRNMRVPLPSREWFQTSITATTATLLGAAREWEKGAFRGNAVNYHRARHRPNSQVHIKLF